MKNTRFMEVMFSNKDEELAMQVDSDIKKAVEDGEVDTEEIKYVKTPDGNVAITDKENGEVTIAEKDPNEADTYNLIAVPDGQLEKYLHPSDDGVTPGDQVGAPDEKIENHIGNGADVCPDCGQKECVCEKEGDEDEKVKEFSEVTSDNQAWQRIFSMPQEFCDYLFSEVIDSEETSVVGDLKVEKNPDETNSVIVTSESTGDQVKVTLTGDQMEVTELNSKNFCGCPKFVVGVQPYDHFIVDTQASTEEAAIELKRRLEEDGVEAVQILENQDDARDYAIGLLKSLGADPEEGGEVAEPEEQKEFSEYYGADSFYTHSYSTNNTVFMSRLFSENEMGIAETRDAVEEAIHGGKEVMIENVIVTPIDAQSAVIKDGNETTRAILTGEGMVLVPGVDEDGEEVEDEDEAEEEEVYTNEDGTKCFSATEEMTSYMIRLFSEEAEEDVIEEAIESGKQIENESEIVTPVDNSCAVIEDKATGEFTKAEILDDNRMEVTKISEDEADSLTENLKVAEAEDNEEAEKEDEEGNEEAEEKEYSMTAYMTRLFSEDEAAEEKQCIIETAIEEGVELENDVEIVTPVDDSTAIVEDKETGEFTKVTILDDERLVVSPITTDEAEALTEDIKVDTDSEEVINEAGTKCYSANEERTSYMVRLFSEEAKEADIEKAISEGEVVENETEVITPVDENIAVIKDKENGEYTKAEVMDDDRMEITKITEEDAEGLLNKEGEEKPAEEEEGEKVEEEDKSFSTISKFFSEEVVAPAPAAAPVAEQPAEEQHSVEEIEDKAAAAIQSIQAAAEEAATQIAEAKAAPAQSTEPEIKEAQFSEKTFSQTDTLVSWLKNK